MHSYFKQGLNFEIKDLRIIQEINILIKISSIRLTTRFINIGTLPKFCYETKVKWIIKLIAGLINLLQKVLQQTDSSSEEFQQRGIYVALSL